ncbi:MAG: ATP-binding cassette domain-containing protein, partial [Bradyrhizobium sp.]|nr:ATP-binding cassette domain-containing protein [Bradyrhizobium sp.]
GCGKTTSLKMINRLVEPTGGEIRINGEDVTKKNPTQLRRDIGYVIQGGGLIPHMSVADNIALVPKLKKWNNDKISRRTDELLDMVGLDPSIYRDRFPRELSGGQQQRVAVARALAMNPDLVLADEPTGNLDTKSAEAVFGLMREVNRAVGTSFLLVTHNLDLARRCDRIIEVVDGRIQPDGAPLRS